MNRQTSATRAVSSKSHTRARWWCSTTGTRKRASRTAPSTSPARLRRRGGSGAGSKTILQGETTMKRLLALSAFVLALSALGFGQAQGIAATTTVGSGAPGGNCLSTAYIYYDYTT